jgi:transaldolase
MGSVWPAAGSSAGLRRSRENRARACQLFSGRADASGTPDAATVAMDSIQRLLSLGQSVWLDFLDRDLLRNHKLVRMVRHDGLRGLTSNPTIFQKALAIGGAYDDDIRNAHREETNAHVLERAMVHDLQAACDALRPAYESTGGADGFASIEVSPLLAHDTEGSVGEARRLWHKVARPNLMVKIPATHEGIAAIFRCLCEGININITLLFSVARYGEVHDAYVRALEERVARGEPIDRIASVASFFVSRVDTKVDKALDAVHGTEAMRARALRGHVAIANAKIAYEAWEETTKGARYAALARAGARPQRLLWASTSTKDPAYDDLYYVEALVGRDTVDTMTLATFEVYQHRGDPRPSLSERREEAHRELEELADLGIDFDVIAKELEDDGVRSFADAFRTSLEGIAEKRRRLSAA